MIGTDQIKSWVVLMEGTLGHSERGLREGISLSPKVGAHAQSSDAAFFPLGRANRVLPTQTETLLKRNPNPWMTWISSQGKRNCRLKPKWPLPWPNQWPKCKWKWKNRTGKSLPSLISYVKPRARKCSRLGAGECWLHMVEAVSVLSQSYANLGF